MRTRAADAGPKLGLRVPQWFFKRRIPGQESWGRGAGRCSQERNEREKENLKQAGGKKTRIGIEKQESALETNQRRVKVKHVRVTMLTETKRWARNIKLKTKNYCRKEMGKGKSR